MKENTINEIKVDDLVFQALSLLTSLREKNLLKLKFVIGANQSWAQYKDALSKRIIEVDGVLNFEVKKVMDVDKRTVFTR